MTFDKVAHVEDLQVLRKSLYARYGRDFQSAAERFDEEGARRWSRAYDWYLRDWLPANREARIADLACGGGNLLFFLRERGYRNLIGVDISADQVARARQVVPDVVCTDALEWLEHHESSFDLLTALDLIEHLTRGEALRFLERCHRALKPGGRLILQTPNAGAPFGMDFRYGDPTHEWCYNANQITRLLHRVGFQDVEIREQGPVPWGYSFASSARWVLWKLLCAGVQLWWLAETGARARVLSKNMILRATRR
jgi:SAM-dependent methyltransferase